MHLIHISDHMRASLDLHHILWKYSASMSHRRLVNAFPVFLPLCHNLFAGKRRAIADKCKKLYRELEVIASPETRGGVQTSFMQLYVQIGRPPSLTMLGPDTRGPRNIDYSL